MFSEMPDPTYWNVDKMTYNDHEWALLPETFETDITLNDLFMPLATSTDPNTGTKFVAAMEGRGDNPFFATQFHPEKPATIYNNTGISHSWAAVQYSRYFADYFIEMTRENMNTCGKSWDECQDMIIENTPVTVTKDHRGNVYAFD